MEDLVIAAWLPSTYNAAGYRRNEPDTLLFISVEEVRPFPAPIESAVSKYGYKRIVPPIVIPADKDGYPDSDVFQETIKSLNTGY